MRGFACLLALAMAVAPTNALAQNYERDADGSVGMAFLRLPLNADDDGRLSDDLVLGFGAYAGWDCAGLSTLACPQSQVGFEYRFTGAERGSFLVGPGGDLGFASLAANASSDGGGGRGAAWVWITLGVAATVLLVGSALENDEEDENCPVDTIPNPITGECEPFP